MSTRAPLTVTQINELVRMTFDSNKLFSSIAIVGEISNLKVHFASGHIYFSLKDTDSVLKCVMFRPSAMKLNFVPENGMKVIAKGRLSVYPRDGAYQLYAEEMEPDGLGSRYLAFEQLKNRLASEGLFDEEHKQKLPFMPKRIGVITSASGAAFQDILNILKRRYPIGEVLLYPASVQGAEAAPSLIAGINWFSANKNMADVLIIGRGGGSFEDLNAFNDEKLARAIAACPIPVISAVGHETDFTICDFVSDKRAPTPSAAAELVAPDVISLTNTISAYRERMHMALNAKIIRLSERVQSCAESKMLSSPTETIEEKERIFLQIKEYFLLSGDRMVKEKGARLASCTGRLEALNPMSVLRRGYCAVFDEENTVVSSTKKINENDILSLAFADGTAKTKVLNIERKETQS